LGWLDDNNGNGNGTGSGNDADPSSPVADENHP
jgi:hypothetical protein